jgi:prevent-host-death family protein
MHTWQVQEAKAKFSQLIDECQKEPQLVTRNGEAAAYVISSEQYEKITTRKKPHTNKMTVGEFFRSSPLFAAGLELDLYHPRVDGSHRDIHFDDEDEGDESGSR